MSDSTPASGPLPEPPPTPPISTLHEPGDPNAATPDARAQLDQSTASADAADLNQTGPYLASTTGESEFSTSALGGQRYQTRKLHRQGGLGAVWLARDTLLGRDVALKSIRPDRMASAEQMARFTHEARVTGQLEHPSIVPLYDLIPAESAAVGSSPDSHGPRYVMRFVTGRTLSESAAEYQRRRAAGEATRLDLANLLDALVAVCRAVAYAHSRGILHRDLKGLNVILGGFGEVFLVDWGLAKSVGDVSSDLPEGGGAADATGSYAQTQAGAALGTPAYMAPEVAAGESATKRSDIYGLRCFRAYQIQVLSRWCPCRCSSNTSPCCSGQKTSWGARPRRPRAFWTICSRPATSRKSFSTGGRLCPTRMTICCLNWRWPRAAGI